MRRLLALLAVLLCAGCGPRGTGAPFTDSRIPPSLEQRFWPPPGWGWGLIQAGEAPPIRYGVAGPGARSRGDVLILCGYGESAEDWFEPVRALQAEGYAVWVMDGAGQGGSGRYARPRDLGHAPDFRAEVEGLRAMTAVIGRPPMLIAQSTAAATALTALSSGLEVRGVILSAPVVDTSRAPLKASAAGLVATLLRRVGLDGFRAAGQQPWSRTDLARGRSGVIAAWQGANPDLRMGGPSIGYLSAFERQTASLGSNRLGAIRTPVVALEPGAGSADPAAGRLCRSLGACRSQTIAAGRGDLHLEDGAYEPWLRAVESALKTAFPRV